MNKIGRKSQQLSFYGSFNLSLDGKIFQFSTSSDGINSNFGILFEICNQGFRNDRLSINFRKHNNGLLEITLEKIGDDQSREAIVNLSIDDQSNACYKSISKNWTKVSPDYQVLEAEYFDSNIFTAIQCEYTLSYPDNLIESSMQINDRESFIYTVITNREGNIQQTMDCHLKSWYKGFGIFLNDHIIDKSITFNDYVEKSSWTLILAEKCHMIRRHSTDVTCVLPWDKDCLSLVSMLASYLNMDIDGIRLFNEEGLILHENKELDIDKFRTSDYLSVTKEHTINTTSHIKIYYDISTTSMDVLSIQSSYDSCAIIIPEECITSELKERLAQKLDIDERRLILFRNDIFLQEDSRVSIEDTFVFLVAAMPYDEMKQIRQGSFGPIFKCSINSSETIVALKEFKMSKMDNSYIREFLVLSSLEPHPNIVQYLDIFVSERSYFIGMEFQPRGSLRDYLNDSGPLKQDKIRFFTYNILIGLQYLHNKHIIHRDIKAANVLLGEDYIAKLCDFGLSKILKQCNTKQLSVGVTLTEECGTVRWMAPEVLNGEKYALKADIWSVGVTVIEMITGEIPYPKHENTAALYEIGTNKRIEFTSPEPMSSELREFVNSCLKPSPSERPRVENLLLMDLITLP